MRYALCLLLVFAPAGLCAQLFDDEELLRRGDADFDGRVTIADAVYINSYLYQGGAEPPCLNQANANDDATLDGADAIYLLNWLFLGGPPPPPPGPFNSTCARDRVEPLGCSRSPCGEQASGG